MIFDRYNLLLVATQLQSSSEGFVLIDDINLEAMTSSKPVLKSCSFENGLRHQCDFPITNGRFWLLYFFPLNLKLLFF